MQIVTLSFDDFSPKNSGFFYICELKRLYPKLKVSLFTIPMSVMSGEVECIADEKFVSEIKRYTHWIEFIPHGFSHLPLEFKRKTYDETINCIKAWERLFKESNLPFVRGFKAPYWEYNEQVIKALNDMGYWMAINRGVNHNSIKTYQYNWSIQEELPKDKEIILGHGHIQNVCGNGLEECFSNLLTIPEDAEFKFVSEIVNENSNYSSDNS